MSFRLWIGPSRSVPRGTVGLRGGHLGGVPRGTSWRTYCPLVLERLRGVVPSWGPIPRNRPDSRVAHVELRLSDAWGSTWNMGLVSSRDGHMDGVFEVQCPSDARRCRGGWSGHGWRRSCGIVMSLTPGSGSRSVPRGTGSMRWPTHCSALA